MRLALLPIFASLALAGCASARFADQPVVWAVDDARNIEKPDGNGFHIFEYMADVFIFRRITRALELPDRTPAKNTNAWDEVPNSSWFTNRIGVLDLSPEEVARGPIDGPDPQPPFLIVDGKSGGGNPGFFATDALGRKFLFKFDTKGNPEQQTSVDVIVDRIFHAAGYHVPKDRVLNFCESDLRIEEGAQVKNKLRQKEPFTPEVLQAILLKVPRRADGCFRGLASEFLPGVPIGGLSPEGVRGDDPNDTIAHEHRRELRGLRVFAAWLNHTDMKEDNTLDMYVEEDGRHFVRHYLVDFGEAFAGHASEKGRYEDGYEYFWDWGNQTLAFLSLGLWVRPWEHLTETRWLSVGSFTDQYFDPRSWREAYPYWPFAESDASDEYWGAKLVMRFSPAMIEAVVAEAKMSDPSAAAYLTHALIERQRLIGEAYIEAVTPLDYFREEPAQNRLCMVDLGVRFGLADQGFVEVLDDLEEPIADYTVDRTGRVCLPLPATADYQVLRVRTRRGRKHRPPLELHVKQGRLLGVVRTSDQL